MDLEYSTSSSAWGEVNLAPLYIPMKITSPVISLPILFVMIALITALSPAEASLGYNARVVYLHGAWVWASLGVYVAAGAIGLVGLFQLILRVDQSQIHQWSRALGRSGLVLWITYLPISLWAMQTNWNGLFLAEPRWRIAVIFAITGLLLQLGLSFTPVSWASFWNFAFITTLFLSLQTTEKVMHPPSPMLDSNAWRIQIFYTGLVALMILVAWQIARGFKSLDGRWPRHQHEP